MDLPTSSGEPLAQPTRARLFNALTELRRPAGTDELAERLGLHPNGVRGHLERLHEAGLVTRARTRQARGRPRDMWSLAPDARPGGEPPTAYTDLSRWLTRAIRSGRTSQRALERTGREIGRELAPDAGSGSSEEAIYATLVALGFQPERDVDRRGGLTYRLCNCPYRDAASGNQDVVCTLHRGMTRGLLDVVGPDTKLAGFVPRDPHAAGCLIELLGGVADEAAAERSGAQA